MKQFLFFFWEFSITKTSCDRLYINVPNHRSRGYTVITIKCPQSQMWKAKGWKQIWMQQKTEVTFQRLDNFLEIVHFHKMSMYFFYIFFPKFSSMLAISMAFRNLKGYRFSRYIRSTSNHIVFTAVFWGMFQFLILPSAAHTIGHPNQHYATDEYKKCDFLQRVVQNATVGLLEGKYQMLILTV